MDIWIRPHTAEYPPYPSSPIAYRLTPEVGCMGQIDWAPQKPEPLISFEACTDLASGLSDVMCRFTSTWAWAWDRAWVCRCYCHWQEERGLVLSSQIPYIWPSILFFCAEWENVVHFPSTTWDQGKRQWHWMWNNMSHCYGSLIISLSVSLSLSHI